MPELNLEVQTVEVELHIESDDAELRIESDDPVSFSVREQGPPGVKASIADIIANNYQYQIPSTENSGVTRTFAGKAIGLKIEVFILNAPLLQGVDFTAAYVGNNTVVTLAEDPFGTPAVYANYWIE